jgi:hypothetical protein
MFDAATSRSTAIPSRESRGFAVTSWTARTPVVVQCQVESTPESLFQQALGVLGVHAELSVTKTNTLQGTLDLSGNIELGKLLAKGTAEVSAGGELERVTERELQPVGQTAADLSWVARILQASGRHLVLEDFHYLSDDERTRFAFMLKALGDYGVYVIVVARAQSCRRALGSASGHGSALADRCSSRKSPRDTRPPMLRL